MQASDTPMAQDSGAKRRSAWMGAALEDDGVFVPRILQTITMLLVSISSKLYGPLWCRGIICASAWGGKMPSTTDLFLIGLSSQMKALVITWRTYCHFGGE